MIAVVESGSTKADWMVISDAGSVAYSTKGFNPYFHSKEDILLELGGHLDLGLLKEEINRIHFYGASCSSPSLQNVVKEGLSAFFGNAEITVNHDLDACAFACYNGVPEIACILGTGSNSCFFDGRVVHEEVPALGHILGDEASGSYFGKQMIADYFYKKLPSQMHRDIEAIGMDQSIMVEKIYRNSDANVYIASFFPVLIRNRELEYSQKLIRTGIQLFIDNHIKCYPNCEEVEVNFVGSVADLLKNELTELCAKNNLKIGRIMRRPLQNLVNYHLSK